MLRGFRLSGGVACIVGILLLIVFIIDDTANNKKSYYEEYAGNQCEQNIHEGLKRFDGGEVDHKRTDNENGNMYHHRIFFWQRIFFYLFAILSAQGDQNK
jgi:hypothetical protein